MLGHPELCNAFYTDTGAVVHMTHQVISRTPAKTETYLGLLSLMTEAIGIEQFTHIQEDLAEVIVDARHLERPAARRGGRRGAQLPTASTRPRGSRSTPLATGIPKASQRLPRSFASSARAASWRSRPRTTCRAAPPTTSSATCSPRRSPDRSACGCSAWPGTPPLGFAGRQTLYEYFFFGDPVRMAGALLKATDREPFKERVSAFLDA